jgi:hypothetical protein
MIAGSQLSSGTSGPVSAFSGAATAGSSGGGSAGSGAGAGSGQKPFVMPPGTKAVFATGGSVLGAGYAADDEQAAESDEDAREGTAYGYSDSTGDAVDYMEGGDGDGDDGYENYDEGDAYEEIPDSAAAADALEGKPGSGASKDAGKSFEMREMGSGSGSASSGAKKAAAAAEVADAKAAVEAAAKAITGGAPAPKAEDKKGDSKYVPRAIHDVLPACSHLTCMSLLC